MKLQSSQPRQYDSEAGDGSLERGGQVGEVNGSGELEGRERGW